MVNNVRWNHNANHSYAHLVKENPFQKVSSSINTHATNIGNLGKAITRGEGSDYTLGRLNDTTIRMGSLGIATLASSKALSTVAGIGEFLGFASWFAAMGISPKIINKMVKVKYGLDLDKEYIDSYGRRKKLFEDPGFICWDLIPDKELYHIGDRMGVPKNIINRKEAIQEKIQQVVVQSKTWMMVSAGIATPVIASLIGDALKKPTNSVLSFFHNRSLANLEANIQKAIQGGNTAKAQELLKKVVQKTYGKTDASAIARMWKAAPEQMTKKAGIIDGAVAKLGELLKSARKAVSGKDGWISKVAGRPNRASQAKKLEALIEHLRTSPDKAKEGAKVLEESLKTARGWKEVLMKHENLLDDATKEFIRVRSANLEAGFGGMKKVLDLAAQGNADPKVLKRFLVGITDAQAQRWSVEKIAEYIGKDAAKEVKELLAAGKTEKAIDLISKRPIKFADDAAKDILLHSRWLKRIGGIGLGLLAATAIYVFFFIGRSNKFNPAIKQNGGNA